MYQLRPFESDHPDLKQSESESESEYSVTLTLSLCFLTHTLSSKAFLATEGLPKVAAQEDTHTHSDKFKICC